MAENSKQKKIRWHGTDVTGKILFLGFADSAGEAVNDATAQGAANCNPEVNPDYVEVPTIPIGEVGEDSSPSEPTKPQVHLSEIPHDWKSLACNLAELVIGDYTRTTVELAALKHSLGQTGDTPDEPPSLLMARGIKGFVE